MYPYVCLYSKYSVLQNDYSFPLVETIYLSNTPYSYQIIINIRALYSTKLRTL